MQCVAKSFLSIVLPQVILSEPSQSGETPFFETWLQMCMPEEGKILNPDHPCFRPEPGKVESLVALLNTSSEMKLVYVREYGFDLTSLCFLFQQKIVEMK